MLVSHLAVLLRTVADPATLKIEISGNAITLGGNIVNLSTNLQTIDLDMGISGARTIQLSNGADPSVAVTLNGDIFLSNLSTTVNGGTLRVSGTGSINSSSGITVNDSGSTFEYTSSVGLDRDVTVDTVIGGDDSQIYLTYAIPEPRTAALLAGVVGLGMLLLRRRKMV